MRMGQLRPFVALCMHVSPGTHLTMGHCVVCIYVSSTSKEVALYCCIVAMPIGTAIRGRTVECLLLWQLPHPGENPVTAVVSQERGWAVLGYPMAAASARRGLQSL